MTANTKKKAATAEPTQPAVWRIEGHDSLFGVESASVTFRFYRVQRNTYGDLKCCGHSDGERCWPFFQHGVCRHVQAVEAFLQSEASPKEVRLGGDHGPWCHYTCECNRTGDAEDWMSADELAALEADAEPEPDPDEAPRKLKLEDLWESPQRTNGIERE